MDTEVLPEYDKWNEQKKVISTKTRKIFFREREIWWCSVGLNVGKESYGKGRKFRRPVLVLKKLSKELCIAVPLTTKEKTGNWFTSIVINGEKRWVMLYQIRLIDIKRFSSVIDVLSLAEFNQTKEKLEKLLELSHRHPAESGDH